MHVKDVDKFVRKVKSEESPKVATIEEKTQEEKEIDSEESVKEYAQDREETDNDSLGLTCNEMLLFEIIDMAE